MPVTTCPRCDAPLEPDDRFCPKCGVNLASVLPPMPPYAYAAPPPVPPPGGVWTPYGAPVSEWWPRVGAMLLDSLILVVPTVVVELVIVAGFGSGVGASAAQFVISLLIGGFYFGVLNGTGTGQTIGNRAAGIAVRDANHNDVIGRGRGWLRWFVRFALYLFLVLPGLLNDLWPLWDRQRQTLADKAAGSVMIRLR
jgi:uncharacterized RDD family membrane protein YckC